VTIFRLGSLANRTLTDKGFYNFFKIRLVEDFADSLVCISNARMTSIIQECNEESTFF
jgi:hypothetical protein